uniref:kxDL motif-containing protein 1 isoform X3 n=1 Tax=Callospermophilus lateralis TaxID=76772 RepID=UPI004038C16A
MDPPDSASRVFCSRILSMVNTDDVNAIILAQKNMLDRFEKTNEMLLNFNNLSSARLQQMSERFLHHTRTLVEMKRDLDSIFRRISSRRTQHLCLYVVLRIEPGPHACQASALPLEPHPQPQGAGILRVDNHGYVSPSPKKEKRGCHLAWNHQQ